MNEDQNIALLQPITMEEVEIVVKQTPEGKSLGLDDFTYDIFHYYWHFIKNDVWHLIEESRKTSGLVTTFNATFLTHPQRGTLPSPQILSPDSSLECHLQNNHKSHSQ